MHIHCEDVLSLAHKFVILYPQWIEPFVIIWPFKKSDAPILPLKLGRWSLMTSIAGSSKDLSQSLYNS